MPGEMTARPLSGVNKEPVQSRKKPVIIHNISVFCNARSTTKKIQSNNFLYFQKNGKRRNLWLSFGKHLISATL